MKKASFIFLSFFYVTTLYAQNIRNEKFGEISLEDFNPKSSVIDKDAAAIVLSDVGNTDFEGNNNGDFSVVYKRHKKILIKKHSAFDEATLKIYLWQFSSSAEERLEDLEAATYNIVDGKVVQTKLAKKDIIKENFSKNILLNKFTLPELHENCIIEYKYTTRSPFDNRLPSWNFQDEYPTLWSEYQVTIPPMYSYAIIKKGIYHTLVVDSNKLKYKNYSILLPATTSYGSSKIFETSGDAKWLLWAMKEIPAYKPQQFVTNPQDHIARYDFRLHQIRYSEEVIVRKIKSWFETAASMLQQADFGQILDKEKNEWLEKEVTTLTGNKEGKEAANIIFQYVRDNFTAKKDGDIFMSDEPKKVFKNKKGNVADINLLLTAMLYNKGYIAEPVILSTRGNGKVDEVSAIINQYDYVICRLTIDSTIYFLDASEKNNGFGKLPIYCYNGYGRIIAPTPTLVNLSADENKESKVTSVFMSNNESGKMEASFTSNLGYEESQQLRDRLVKTSTSDFFKETAKSYSFTPVLSNTEIENHKNFDLPIAVKYDMTFSLGDEDIIYFNPLMAEITKENIFKAEKRIFNVEMPAATSETYILNMEIPKGYVVDELPKSVRSKLNEDEGLFEYIISNKNGLIQLKCVFQLNKANYLAEDYDSLREFFGLMVKKQSEQIVFKKIKQ